jgi:hypothetical protein
MTENAFGRKPKPESCRPCTSHAFDPAPKEKDDWEIAMDVGYKEGDGINSQSDALSAKQVGK